MSQNTIIVTVAVRPVICRPLPVVKERVTLLPHSHSHCCQKIPDQICCQKILDPRPYSGWNSSFGPERLAVAQENALTMVRVRRNHTLPNEEDTTPALLPPLCKNSVHPWCISMLYTTLVAIIQCPYEVLRT